MRGTKSTSGPGWGEGIAVAVLSLLGCSQRVGPVDQDGGDAGTVDAAAGDVLVLRNTTTLSVGVGYACAIRDGQGYCWGINASQQLGAGEAYQGMDHVRRAVPVALPNDLQEIHAGTDFTCARRADNSVWCWGDGRDGATGRGVDTVSTDPAVATMLSPCLAVSTGRDACCIQPDRTIACAGMPLSGPYPPDGGPQTTVITGVAGITDAEQISVGLTVACATRQNHQVTCWGDERDLFGQLGDGSVGDAVFVGAGGQFACALRAGGAVSCWGSGAAGTLGDGTTVDRSTPGRVHLSLPAEEIAVGSGHACARSGGRVYCWGDNSYGGLGDGTRNTSNVPVEVVGLQDAVGIAAGYRTTCALRTSGGVVCWGSNLDGELGNDTPVASSVPTEVLGF